MMWPVILLPEANKEFDESFDWYAARSANTARNFSGEIDKALSRIATNPDLYPLIDTVHQVCSVRKFPFRLVYRKLEDRLLFVAVAHTRRRPGFWTTRSES